MIQKIEERKSKIITYIVFAFTFLIVILSLISLFFPAFLVISIMGSERDVNPFELGRWVIPFVSINLSILVFALLYYKQILPNVIVKAFKFVINFEISKKTATVFFLIIIGIYILFTVGELTEQEGSTWKDWEILGKIIEEFPSGGDDTPGLRILYVKNFLLYSSQEVFQNVKIIPFIGSLSLVFLTYLLTVQISKKRFAGLIAMVILLQSHTFLRYDTTATFSNFWVSLYLVSLYLIYKKWPLSPLAFVASIFSKPITFLFFPMTIFFAIRTKISKKAKIGITVSYLIIFVLGVGALFFVEGLGYGKSLTSFDYFDFVSGLTAWAFQLRIDGLVLVFLLPLYVGLLIKSLKGKQEADSIMVIISGILLSVPILSGFTEFNIQPYRWIPLITFFAIGVGTLFSKSSPGRSEN